MPIFLHAPRQVLWDSALYLFEIKGLSNNKQHWQRVLAYVGSIYCTTGKVRDWELSSFLFFLLALSERLLPWDSRPVCVVKTRVTLEGNRKQHNNTWDWPIVCPYVKSSTLFPVLIFPFGCLWAIYFVLLCLLYRDYISCCLPNTFDCNPVAFWRKNTRSWQKTKHYSCPGSWITNSPGQSLSFYL